MTKKTEAEKGKRGRKSTYTQEAADEICECLAGGEPLAQICRDERMPAYRTVYSWAEDHPDFAAKVAHAREAGFDQIALDALKIADETHEGEETEIDDKGVVVKTKRGDMLGHRKLRIETRLKLLACWDPKRYGQKVGLGGADDLPAIKTSPDLEDTARKVAFLFASGLAAKAKPVDK